MIWPPETERVWGIDQRLATCVEVKTRRIIRRHRHACIGLGQSWALHFLIFLIRFGFAFAHPLLRSRAGGGKRRNFPKSKSSPRTPLLYRVADSVYYR
ncbi:hypothetical protein BDW59DRAFT_136950 [Aspergillus cavernicola]|uniref:Uncharacterized protein n=1 Tax=Aspergillus cavernicola TaxID=176166 RepID=A0ABR4J4N1_9EURO